MDTYLSSNKFLTSINNEISGSRNATYADNLASLDNLVLVIFNKDKTVLPKESAWFGSEAVNDEDDIFSNQYENMESVDQLALSPVTPTKKIIPMRLQPLYTEDWIGLRKLDERGSVIFETCEGEHMHMGDCWESLVERFVGSIPK